jgi:hypothetical protein
MVAALLLVVMATALPGAHTLAFLATQPARPAGCHGHGSAAPSPAPTSFRCCAGGHHVAIPSASFSPRPLAVQLCRLAADEHLTGSFARDRLSAMLMVPSNGPPVAAPLRI